MISSFTQGNQSYVGHCTVIKEIEEEIVQHTTMGRFEGPSSQVQAQAQNDKYMDENYSGHVFS